MSDYKRLITKPWRRLKRERLGGAKKPFHATEFEQGRSTMYQIAFTWVNTALGNIKTALAGTYHHVSAKQAQRYLASAIACAEAVGSRQG